MNYVAIVIRSERFRLYQILNRLTKDQKKAIQNHLKSGGNSGLSEDVRLWKRFGFSP